MAEQSAIEWCDSTFNPWIGCTKVSPACDHCYAEAQMSTRLGRVQWGAGQQRQRTSDANWRQPVRWNARADRFGQCDVCGWRGERTQKQGRTKVINWAVCPTCKNGLMQPARRRVFCASLADVFDNEVPVQWRIDLMKLIVETPNLDWLLLTKRIGNAASMLQQTFRAVHHGREFWSDNVLPNVWIGATICNQAEADRDIPKLLSTPARVRFLSIEPMLGPVDIRWALPDIRTGCCHRCGFRTNRVGGVCPADGETLRGDIGVDWVICGGESGPKARPMHPDWLRSLRDQCAAAGVPFLFKQWGEWAPRAGKIFGSGTDFQSLDPSCTRWPQVSRLGEHGKDTRICENCTPDMGEEVYMQRVGKKAAGRLLDGREHNGFPGVTP